MSFDLRLTITGAPLAADLDPNTSAPTLDRIFTTPTKAGSTSNGPVQILGILKDGTSCNFTVWVYSPELLAWFKIGDTTNLLAKRLGTIGNVPCSADVFVQLTNVVGAPTMFGVSVGYGSKSQDAPTEPDSWKQPVRLATVAALPACALVGNTLTGNVNGVIPPATTDGSAVAATNDILIKTQGGGASHLQDGIFRVIDEGLAGVGGRPWVLTRTPHCDESGEVFDGMMVAVGEGATLAGHVFEQVTNGPITINVTALEFRDLGSLLALVTAAASGTVSSYGANPAGSTLTNGAPTVGGTWSPFLRAFADHVEANVSADFGAGAAPDSFYGAASNTNGGGGSSGGRTFITCGHGVNHGGTFIMDADGVTARISMGQTGDVFLDGNTLFEVEIGGLANTRFTVRDTESTFFLPSVRIGPLVAATTIGYAADTTLGAVRPQLTHVGQDSTVAGSTGGRWAARAGHGVANHGVLALQDADGQDRLSVSTTNGLIFNGATTDFFNAGAVTFTGNPTVNGGTNRWSFGSAPAVVGSPFAFTDGGSIAWRYNTGPVDYCAVSWSATALIVGGAAVGTRAASITIDAANQIYLKLGGSDNFGIYATYSEFTAQSPTVRWTATTVAPALMHVASTVVGDVCDNLLFQAQSAAEVTGGASTSWSGNARCLGGARGGHADNKTGSTIIGGMADYAYAGLNQLEGGVVIPEKTHAPAGALVGAVAIWCDGGAAHCMGTSATNTTFGPAGSHCPECHTDHLTVSVNEKWGTYVATCHYCGWHGSNYKKGGPASVLAHLSDDEKRDILIDGDHAHNMRIIGAKHRENDEPPVLHDEQLRQYAQAMAEAVDGAEHEDHVDARLDATKAEWVERMRTWNDSCEARWPGSTAPVSGRVAALHAEHHAKASGRKAHLKAQAKTK